MIPEDDVGTVGTLNGTAVRIGVMAIALASGCSSSGRERTDTTRAATPIVTSTDRAQTDSAQLTPAMLGKWQPFSRVASDQMGDLELTGTEAIFSKGYRFTYRWSGPILTLDAPRGTGAAAAAAICGNSAPLSMTAHVDSAERPVMLRLAFFSVKTGPNTARDLDRGLCSKVSYSRQ